MGFVPKIETSACPFPAEFSPIFKLVISSETLVFSKSGFSLKILF